MDEEDLFERSLDELDAWQTSLAACADQYDAEHPEVVADLRLAHRLQEVRAPQGEVVQAKARVHLALMTAIEADAASQEADRGDRRKAHWIRLENSGDVKAPLRFPVRRRRPARRPAMLAAAAMLLLTLIGAWAASSAADSTLPGSPLYGLKRAEEGLALATAWSDQRRGDVLVMIAGRRLGELRAEARAGSVSEVRTLTAELDSAMLSLIQLAADMRAHHEDVQKVEAGLAQTLQAEGQTLRSAQQSGQTVLAQALGSAAQDQQAALQANNLPQPPVSSVPTAGGPSPSGGSAASASTSPTPAAPTPTPVRGGSGPTGSGTGRGSGGSGGSGIGGPAHGHGPSTGGVSGSGGATGAGSAPAGGMSPLGGWHRQCFIDC